MSTSKEKVVMTAAARTCLRASWPVFSIVTVLMVFGLPAAAQSPSFTAIDGTIGPGAQYEIVMPTEQWNGELVVFIHGIVAPEKPVALFVPGSLRDTVIGQGFAMIYSSFSENGYAVKDGMQRTHQLRGIFTSKVRRPERVYLVGQSLGGLIAVMLAESFPGQYDGALSLGGLLGGGAAEARYMADARVLFDYFFPGVIPGTGFYIPPGIDFSPGGPTFTAVYTALIQGFAPPYKTLQFASTAKLPGNGAAELVTSGMSVAGFAVTYGNNLMDLTNGHMPYDNTKTVYSGSADDVALNAGVARYASDPSAVNYMEHYYTPTGDLHIPVITLHATRDPIVPIFHEPMYAAAVAKAGASQYLLQRTVVAFGHTGLSDDDVAAAFSALVDWVRTGIKPAS